MSRAAPGRVTVPSQTPHLPLMKPLQFFLIRLTRTLMALLLFPAGLSTSHTIRQPELTVLLKSTVFVRGLQTRLQPFPYVFI